MTENLTPQEILKQALKISNRQARAAYLEEACGDDDALRREIASLIATSRRREIPILGAMPAWKIGLVAGLILAGAYLVVADFIERYFTIGGPPNRPLQAEVKLRELKAYLEVYRTVSGMYPTQSQGLAALVTKPITAPEPVNWEQQVKGLPKDPWGQDYIYFYPGRKDASCGEVVYKGDDRILGTKDDISSQDF